MNMTNTLEIIYCPRVSPYPSRIESKNQESGI